MSKNITDLEGNDLWSALTSGEKITSRKKKPTAISKQETSPLYRVREQWQDTSIVLLIHKTNCQCGATYEAPNPIKFIKRRHKATGALHWRRLDEIQIFEAAYERALPFEIAYSVHNVTDCQRCFGLEKLLQGQPILHTSDVPAEIPEKRQPEYVSHTTCDSQVTQETPKAPSVDAGVVNPEKRNPALEVEDEDPFNKQLEA